MPFTDDTSGLEVIPLVECVHLIESAEVARVAAISDGEIVLFPVNFIWDGEAVVFRCEEDSPLARIADTQVVIELDHIDSRARSAWSVVARGTAERIDPDTRAELIERLNRILLAPWAGGEKAVWMRVLPAPLTGRRVNSSGSR